MLEAFNRQMTIDIIYDMIYTQKIYSYRLLKKTILYILFFDKYVHGYKPRTQDLNKLILIC